MTRSARIVWTTNQRAQVNTELARLVQQYDPALNFAGNHNQVSAQILLKLLPEAQAILDSDYHRKWFTEKECIVAMPAVTELIRQAQSKANAVDFMLKEAPIEAIFKEVAGRVTKALYAQIKAELQQQMAAEIMPVLEQMARETAYQTSMREVAGLREWMRHNPTTIPDENGLDGKEVPTYVLAGIQTSAQYAKLKEDYRGKARLIYLKADDVANIPAAVKDRMVFCMAHAKPDYIERVKKLAAGTSIINGGEGELKRLLDMNIRQFEAMNVDTAPALTNGKAV